MGWFLLRDTLGEFGVFPDSSLLGIFDKLGDAPATFVVLGRDGRPCDLIVENVWTYTSLADALAGLCAEKAEGMRVAMHGTEAHAKAICPHCQAPIGQNVYDCPACGKPLDQLPRLPDGFPAPTGDGGELSPLQDGNHPQLEAHRRRIGEASGDAMAAARELLAKKGDKP